jgi:para-nitrobenzyl esterase
MMASPEARGLFHRAVGGSGGRFDGGMMGAPMKTLAEAEADGAKFLESLGARTLDELRNQPADTLYGPRGMFGPIVDGVVLTETVQAAFAGGRQAKVPLITGFNTEEGSPYPIPEMHTRAGFLEQARKSFGDDAGAFLDLYPVTSDEDARAQSYRVRRDGAFAYQAWKWANLHAETGGAPVFMYRFGRQVPLPPGKRFREAVPPGGYGAWHGSELWYMFDTLDTKPFAWSETDRTLAAAMSGALVAFAGTGDPGEPWPRFDRHTGAAVLLDETARAGSLTNVPALEFFTDFYSSHRPAAH